MNKAIQDMMQRSRELGPTAPDRDRRRSGGIWASEYEQYARMSDELRTRVPHHLDVRYGSDPRQFLDIYLPDGDVADAPVMVFFHGGALEEGHPRRYGFLAGPYVERGVIFVSAGYRLMSDEVVQRRDEVEARIGAYVHSVGGEVDDEVTAVRLATAQVGVDAAQDGRAALAWVHDHIVHFGGDPDRIYTSGHSSGAFVAVAAGGADDWQEALGVPTDVVKGIVPVGGRYGLWLANAIISGVRIDDPPHEWGLTNAPAAVIVFGEEEYDGVGQEDSERARHCARINRTLIAALREQGADVEEVALSPRGHWETLRSIADASDRTVPAVLRLMGVAQ